MCIHIYASITLEKSFEKVRTRYTQVCWWEKKTLLVYILQIFWTYYGLSIAIKLQVQYVPSWLAWSGVPHKILDPKHEHNGGTCMTGQ